MDRGIDPLCEKAAAAMGLNLLTGICFCGVCGDTMTLRTGRGSVGDRDRYYACSTKARMRETGCTDLAVPMQKLDDAIMITSHPDCSIRTASRR